MGDAYLIAGCTSDAGKSIIVAGLCRALRRRGLRVAPFKAQNMSNNSAVTLTGGEIGRAQALQAVACGLEPDVRFNPILLKPGSDSTSQLVVNGHAQGQISARSYIEYRSRLRAVAAETLRQLRAEFDVVICEGAGSPAEINLRATDVANFGLAETADLPVYLVGDIDRGGVLAHFYGTHQIVAESDRARIKGFVVNKFRGDQSLLAPGLTQLEELTGVPTVAVVPFLEGLWVDAEDSLQSIIGASIGPGHLPVGERWLSVAAVRLPRVSNATDVEAIACEPGTRVSWVADAAAVSAADLVILPGSKATVSDLAWLRQTGIANALVERARLGLPTVGICGGFQMLCREILDPVESGSIEPVAGLGVFDARIEFEETKTLLCHPNGAYEVHHGQVRDNREQPWIGQEGCRKGNLFGTHRHGQFEDDQFRREFLLSVAPVGFALPEHPTSFSGERLRQLDIIADALEVAWDLSVFEP